MIEPIAPTETFLESELHFYLNLAPCTNIHSSTIKYPSNIPLKFKKTIVRLQIIHRLVAFAFTCQIRYKFFRNQRGFKSINFTLHIDMEPGVLILIVHLDSAKKFSEFLDVFRTSCEFGKISGLGWVLNFTCRFGQYFHYRM